MDFIGPSERKCVERAPKRRRATAKNGKSTSDSESETQAPVKAVFTRKEIATLAQRIKILDWYHANGENQTKTAKHFDAKYPNLKLKQPLISDWVRHEAKWREDWDRAKEGSKAERLAKRPCQTEHPAIDEMMRHWVSVAMSQKINITGEAIRQKWTKFADLTGVPADERLSLSDGWLTRFKARNGLKHVTRHGEAGSAEPGTAESERKRMRKLIKELGYAAKDIFNMDETGLFYAYV